MDELVAAEADLFARRKGLKLTLLDEQGRQVPGSLPAASTALAASSDEAVRQSALAMFQTLEQWVVDNGYLTSSRCATASPCHGLSRLLRLQGAQERADEPGAAVCHS
jgi:hypothetical protein